MDITNFEFKRFGPKISNFSKNIFCLCPFADDTRIILKHILFLQISTIPILYYITLQLNISKKTN